MSVLNVFHKNRLIFGGIGILIFLALPVVVNNNLLIHLAILGMLYAIVASNWDLTLGYAGVFNFAHIAFFGIGAYTSGILAVKLDITPWIGMPAGALAAVIASAIVSIPAIRLRGIYVALLTFAFSQLVVLLLLSQPAISGGQQGLTGVPQLSIGDFAFRESNVAYFYFVGFLLLCSTIFLRRLVTSDFGLSLVALRDFEEYAVARGIPLARQRFLAFLLSSIFPGLAGAVFAHYLIVASPEFFGFSFTTLFLSMVLVGGTSTIYGPVVMGVVMTYVSESLNHLGPARFMIVAVIIVVTMRFFPQGIWGLIKRFAPKPADSPETMVEQPHIPAEQP
jgi:branched-chain amino acid transport system permease protein